MRIIEELQQTKGSQVSNLKPWEGLEQIDHQRNRQMLGRHRMHANIISLKEYKPNTTSYPVV